MIEHNWEVSTSGKIRRLTLDMLPDYAQKITTVSTKEIDGILSYTPSIISEYFHEFVTNWKAVAVNPNTTSQQLDFMLRSIAKFSKDTRDDSGALHIILPDQLVAIDELSVEVTSHPNISKSTIAHLVPIRSKGNNVGQNPQIREHHLREWFYLHVFNAFEAGLGVPVEIFDEFFNRFNAVPPTLIDSCLEKIFNNKTIVTSAYRQYMAILATSKNQSVTTKTLEKCIKWLDDIVDQHSNGPHFTPHFITPVIIEFLGSHPNAPQDKVSILQHKLLVLTGDSEYMNNESKSLFVF